MQRRSKFWDYNGAIMSARRAFLIAIVIATMSIFFLVGCSSNTSQENEDKAHENVDDAPKVSASSQSQPSELPGTDTQSTDPDLIGSPSVPDKEQMTADILSAGANIFFLNNQDESLNINALDLLRRKTDSDYDEAHVSVALANDRYTVDAEYTLYYSYYDVGGWVLDTYTLDSHQSSVTGPLLDDAAFIGYCNQFFSSTEITDRTHGVDPSGIYQDNISFCTTRESTYFTEVYSGHINLAFYDDCWHETCVIEPCAVDWDRLMGTWQFTHYDEYVELTITDIAFIDADHITVTYDYKTSPWHDDGPWYGYYNSAFYWTSGEPREVTGETSQLSLIRPEFIFDGVSCPYIGSIQKGIHIGLGGYTDYGACFWVYIDIDNGLYIDKFMSNYKREGWEGSWHNSAEGPAFLQKISN